MAKSKNKPREDGRVQVSIYLGTVDGKRRYKYVYGATQAEADRKAREVRKRLIMGERIEAGDQSFSVWAERFLDLKNGVSDVYYDGLQGRCRWWCKRIGDLPICKIVTTDIQDGISELYKMGRSKKTLKEYRSTAKCIFELAERDRAIVYNPAEWSEIPNDAPKSKRFALEHYECQWIEDTKDKAQTAAMIALHAGLRRSELLALTAGDIDFGNAVIRVNKAIVYKGNNPKLKMCGKSDAAMRTVPLDDVLAAYLMPILSRKSPMELIVGDDNGEYMTESIITGMWNSYRAILNEKYGQFPGEVRSRFSPGGIPVTIRNITLHILRHTYATMLHAAGVDVLTAKEWLGHSDIKTTMAIYTHLDKVMEEEDKIKYREYINDRKNRYSKQENEYACQNACQSSLKAHG